MKSVIITADLNDGSSSKERAIALYHALDNCKETKPYFYDFNDVDKTASNFRFSNSIHLTKDSIIVLFKEIKNFHQIDKTNVVVYIASEPKIDQFMTFVLPRVNRILAYDSSSCYHIVAALKKLSLEIPVHKIQPYFDASSAKQHFIDNNYKLKIAINGDHKINYAIIRSNKDYDITLKGKGPASHGWKLTNDEFNVDEFDVYLHFSNKNPEKIQSAMASGVIPICLNQSPYNEWIVNGINGFIVSSEMELMEYLNKLSDKHHLINCQKLLIESIKNTMSKQSWVNMFLNVVGGINVENINKEELFKPTDPEEFKWIVPRVVFESGKEIFIPRKYNKNKFLPIKLNGLEETLKFFLTQKFREVYLFGVEYEELDDEQKLNSINNLLNSLGKRSLNIFLVSDKPIPQKHEKTLSKITKISIKDGLNRIS